MTTHRDEIRIDIVSDVVCPWCIVGYLRLKPAMEAMADSVNFSVHWHPFELNPHMPPEGQNLAEHLQQKYGSTPEQSQANRQRLIDAGAELGFEFRFTKDSRTYNTFKAHQLLHWAGEQGQDTALKLALFDAYFTDQKDIGDEAVLLDAVEKAGLDREEAAPVLSDQRFAETVRTQENYWTSQGIHGVPAFIFNSRYLVSGAQETAVFTDVFNKLLTEKAA
ncbi:MAG: DsbA family oxidoreductase [Pseudomonadota bacterium]